MEKNKEILMNINTKTKKRKKSFRLSAKKLFLTYSQIGNMPIQLAIEQIISNLNSYNVVEYLITREEHSEGLSLSDGIDKGKHFHVFIETSKKSNIINPNRLDLEYENQIFHGNYQVAKQKDNVIEYILKDIYNIKDKENILFSKNLMLRIQEGGHFKSYQEAMIDLAEKGKIKDAMDLLKAMDPNQYMKSHASVRKSLNSLFVQAMGCVPKFSLDNFHVPTYLEEGFQNALKEKKTLLLVGEAGTGKSQLLLSYVRKGLKLEPLLINDYNSLRDFKQDFHRAIIIDDIDLSKLSREVIIKLFDSSDEATFDVKYGPVRIPANTPRFIASNKTLSLMMKFGDDEAINRRVITINVGNTKLYQVMEAEPEVLDIEASETSDEVV